MNIQHHSPKFLTAEIEISTNCNRSCTYCPNNLLSEKNTQEIMPLEQFLKILRELSEINFEGSLSYHFYNEPLLLKNLEEYISETKKILPKCQTRLYTNGDYLNQKRLESLLNSGIDRIIVTDHSRQHMDEFRTFRGHLPKERQGHFIIQSPDEIGLTNRGGVLGNLGGDPFKVKTTPCLMPSLALFIDVRGNIISCYEDAKKQKLFGNIFQTTLVDLWQSKDWIEFRQDLKHGKRTKHTPCKSCNNNLKIPG